MCRISICLCILTFFALVVTVPAREVDVTWQMQGGETLDEGKQRAMEKGWAQAVYQEALDLLPGELAPERKKVLRQYLAPHAERFILESSETRLSESVKGMHLGLEVLVDGAALRQLLQRIGVFYTAGAMLPYSLVLADVPGIAAESAEPTDAPNAAAGGVTDAEAGAAVSDAGGDSAAEDIPQQIARLELLTGLQREQGVMPRVQLTREGATWQGRIETASGGYDVAGSDLETLWLSLWGWFFTVHGPEASAPDGSGELLDAELVIEGWPGPGGVYEFEEVLKGFRPALARATLKTLALRAGSVRGVWQLALRDPAAFRSRLDAYMQGRGLTWELEGVPADSVDPVDSAGPGRVSGSGDAADSAAERAMPSKPDAEPASAPPSGMRTPSGQQRLPSDSSASDGPSPAAPSASGSGSSTEQETGWQSSTPLPRSEDLPTNSPEVH